MMLVWYVVQSEALPWLSCSPTGVTTGRMQNSSAGLHRITSGALSSTVRCRIGSFTLPRDCFFRVRLFLPPVGLCRHVSRVSFGKHVPSPHSVRFCPENERGVRFLVKNRNPGLPGPWLLPPFRARAGEAPDELPDLFGVPDAADRSAAAHLKALLSGSSATLSGENPSSPSRISCRSSS